MSDTTAAAKRQHPIRALAAEDIADLLRIEDAAFPGDRLTRRNFRHALGSLSIIALVAAGAEGVEGYIIVETRRNARVARLTSIAVAAEAAGTGLGRRLADAAEAEAARRGCDRMRLEVRADNARAVALYERSGYRRIGRLRRYYEDGGAALRFEKRLIPEE